MELVCVTNLQMNELRSEVGVRTKEIRSLIPNTSYYVVGALTIFAWIGIGGAPLAFILLACLVGYWFLRCHHVVLEISVAANGKKPTQDGLERISRPATASLFAMHRQSLA